MIASLKWLCRNFEALVCTIGFAVMVLAVLSNVILRFTISRSLVATEEIAYLGFGYSIFFGLAILYRNRAMIAVDFIVDRLPPRLHYAVNVFNSILLVVATAYLAYLSYTLAAGGWIRRTAFLNIPYFYVNLAPTLAFALMTGYSLYFLFQLLSGRDLKDARPDQQM
jgi:TRAP-type C4-dicarboxylate transport system permease small subunit